MVSIIEGAHNGSMLCVAKALSSMHAVAVAMETDYTQPFQLAVVADLRQFWYETKTML